MTIKVKLVGSVVEGNTDRTKGLDVRRNAGL